MKRASSSSDSCRRHRVLPSSKTAPIRSSQPDGGTEGTSQLPAARRHPRVPPTPQHPGLRKLSGDEKGHRWAWGWGGKWVLPTGQTPGGSHPLPSPGDGAQPRGRCVSPGCKPQPRPGVGRRGDPARGPAERLLPSALNICTPPNFPSKRTVLFRGLNARIMRMRSTSRQPDAGRERQGRAGGFPAPQHQAPGRGKPRCKPRLFIPKSRRVIPINPGWGVGWGFRFRFPIASTIFHRREISSRHRGRGGAPRQEGGGKKMEGRDERSS